MKFEKLTENKLRIILNIEDLETNNIDFDTLLKNTPETQSLILSLLNKAEKEVDFCTEDCKLLIEAITALDGNFVFIVTKVLHSSTQNHSYSRKAHKAKNKLFKPDNNIIYSFQNFDEFCEFCKALHIEFLSHENIKLICKGTSLYFYNNTYYLLLSGINKTYPHLNLFFSIVSEFANRINSPKNFDAKITEHGSPIFKKNAISNTINIFIKQ